MHFCVALIKYIILISHNTLRLSTFQSDRIIYQIQAFIQEKNVNSESWIFHQVKRITRNFTGKYPFKFCINADLEQYYLTTLWKILKINFKKGGILEYLAKL